MPQPNLKKNQSKKTFGRLESIRRSNHSSLPIFEEQSWAVSYADFLMVLLSFFIIFFNTNDKSEKNNIILKITNEIQDSMKTSNPTVAAQRQTAAVDEVQIGKSNAGKTTIDTKLILNKINENFRNFKFIENVKENSIYIQLPDNAYGPGEYNLNDSLKLQFDALIEKLKPFNGQIELTVIGHSDKLNVRNPAGRRFEDNIELSSLRASMAVRRALALGVDENSIKIKTSVTDSRNTRSISVMIKTL